MREFSCNHLLFCVLLITTSLPLRAQSFEGCITLTTSIQPGRSSVLIVREDKRKLEVREDTSVTLVLIRDEGAGTTTVLRRQGDQAFGYRSASVQGRSPVVDEAGDGSSDVQVISTDQEAYVGPYRSRLYRFEGKDLRAEAWITTDLPARLSDYFPEVADGHADAEAIRLRQAADRQGFILTYTETGPDDTPALTLEAKPVEQDIPLDAFAVDPGYVVLDAAGLRQLMWEANHDPARRAMLDAFRQQFGNK